MKTKYLLWSLVFVLLLGLFLSQYAHKRAHNPTCIFTITYHQTTNENSDDVRCKPYLQMIKLDPQILGAVIAGISGIITAYFVAYFQRCKDKSDRLMDFRGFLGRWEGLAKKKESDFPKICSEYLEHLHGYIGKCFRDFKDRDEINRLAEDLSSEAREAKNDQDSRDKVFKKVSALKRVV